MTIRTWAVLMVIFTPATKVKERDATVLTAAAATLVEAGAPKAKL